MDKNKFKRDYEPTEYKTVPFVALKYEDEQGIVEHLITVFGIEDLGGDISHPGSFTKTLAERQPHIRVLDCHNSYSIMDVVGVPLELKEIGRDELPPAVLAEHPEATGAVWARTQFLLDTPEGSGVYKRLKSGAVSEFSYAYDALDVDWVEKDDGSRVRNLRTIRLWEYSPVLWGMNQATTVLGVKAEGGDDDPKGAQEPAEGDDSATGLEMKPVDESDTTITVRVRDSGDFESDSFRTIKIGEEGEGIQARIGRLEGETSTTIQAFLFDKPKWTVEKAKAWVEEHHKYVVLIDIQVKEEQSPLPEYAMLQEVEVGIGMLKNIELRGRVGAGPTSSPTP